MSQNDSPLLKAHSLIKQADKYVLQSDFVQAASSHKLAADMLKKALNDSSDPLVLRTLELMLNYHIRMAHQYSHTKAGTSNTNTNTVNSTTSSTTSQFGSIKPPTNLTPQRSSIPHKQNNQPLEQIINRFSLSLDSLFYKSTHKLSAPSQLPHSTTPQNQQNKYNKINNPTQILNQTRSNINNLQNNILNSSNLLSNKNLNNSNIKHSTDYPATSSLSASTSTTNKKSQNIDSFYIVPSVSEKSIEELSLENNHLRYLVNDLSSRNSLYDKILKKQQQDIKSLILMLKNDLTSYENSLTSEKNSIIENLLSDNDKLKIQVGRMKSRIDLLESQLKDVTK